MSVKKVRFDYLRVKCSDYDIMNNAVTMERVLFDLSPIFIRAMELDSVDTTYTLYGENVRIQQVDRFVWRNSETNIEKVYWKLQMLRIRLNILPGIATNTGEFNPLELEDDEYVGEDVAVLYDPEYHLIMIQRNRNSLSPSGIEQYLNRIQNDPHHLIAFEAIPLPEFMRDIGQGDIIKKVVLSLSATNFDTEILPANSALTRIINGVRQCGAVNMTINISMGRGRNTNGLNRGEVLGLANTDINENVVSKYEVYKKDSEDARIEVVDLMSGNLRDEEDFQFSRAFPIDYNRIIDAMFLKYIDRLPLINKLFGV